MEGHAAARWAVPPVDALAAVAVELRALVAELVAAVPEVELLAVVVLVDAVAGVAKEVAPGTRAAKAAPVVAADLAVAARWLPRWRPFGSG